MGVQKLINQTVSDSSYKEIILDTHSSVDKKTALFAGAVIALIGALALATAYYMDKQLDFNCINTEI
ncbi:MAG: hypothetical protein SNF33_04945 [Candidatus Algichlamydia australiensis]|nr:hypothetical protein [Chlamydiales bacterium]